MGGYGQRTKLLSGLADYLKNVIYEGDWLIHLILFCLKGITYTLLIHDPGIHLDRKSFSRSLI